MRQSLDNYEKTYYLKPEIKVTPLSGEIVLADSFLEMPDLNTIKISLDGEWDLKERDGSIDFEDSIKANIPCSVHTALLQNEKITDCDGNVITDPYYALNDEYMRAISKKSFLFRKTFTLTAQEAEKPLRLSFEGVCDTCEVYLNKQHLGMHIGAFGGPDYDVSGIVKSGENELVVLLHSAPFRKRKPYEFPTFFRRGQSLA